LHQAEVAQEVMVVQLEMLVHQLEVLLDQVAAAAAQVTFHLDKQHYFLHHFHIQLVHLMEVLHLEQYLQRQVLQVVRV
jgi:hypothetical protein